MAEGKKTFIFYSDWINIVREMPNEDAGCLLKHILSYVNDEEPTTDNLLVRMAFGHIKPLLKKDLDNWEKKLNRYSEMGKKSAKVRKLTQVEPTLTYVKPTSTVNDNVNVNDTNTIVLDIQKIDNYILVLKSQHQFLDALYMTYKFKPKTIGKIANLFKEHLKMFPKEHETFLDFRNHFKSWIGFETKKGNLGEFLKHQKGEL